MKALLLALLLMAAALPARAATLAETLQKNEAALAAALNRGDAAAAAKMYAEGATLMPPGAPARKGRAEIEKFWADIIKSGAKNANFTTVAAAADNQMAREQGKFTVDLGGGPVAGKYVVVWRKIGNDWLLETDIWNLDK